MFRTVNYSVILVLALGLAGCQACYSPYETCQPTFIPERGDQCMGELYRSGSILGGMERTKNNRECQSCNASSESANYGPQPFNQNGTTNVEPEPMSFPNTDGVMNNRLPQGVVTQDFSLDQLNGEFNVELTPSTSQSFSESVMQQVGVPGMP